MVQFSPRGSSSQTHTQAQTLFRMRELIEENVQVQPQCNSSVPCGNMEIVAGDMKNCFLSTWRWGEGSWKDLVPCKTLRRGSIMSICSLAGWWSVTWGLCLVLLGNAVRLGTMQAISVAIKPYCSGFLILRSKIQTRLQNRNSHFYSNQQPLHANPSLGPLPHLVQVMDSNLSDRSILD